ncbi:uncharacterized protein LOC131676656 [Topomyia yanbarensis]|uniref:uncharacterized protein LOC131676656 n=1 Tax=Topomyia yanbarensis TaxID=2498891 RepID=UPI00273B4491|nr:uncharacterized protein LOC131676656 [Topomyia yanbarensis]
MNKSNLETPTRRPLRRLGLQRSLKMLKPHQSITVHGCLTASSNTEPLTDYIAQTPPLLHSITPSCSAEDELAEAPKHTLTRSETLKTPSNIRSSLKRTRLSLSQTWKNRVINKKELNIKRRKLLDEVEAYSESTEKVTSLKSDESTSDKREAMHSTNVHEKIVELKKSINIWRQGCVQALNDLQERRGTGNMTSLLSMLQIPHDLVNYDTTDELFLDPD